MGGFSGARGSQARRAIALGAAIFAFTGCGHFHERVDGWALSRKAGLIERDAASERTKSPLPFLTAAELEARTRPNRAVQVTISPLVQHRLPNATGLTQELVTFESAWPLRYAESDRATAYVYRQGQLGERPVILWMPGQSTDDFVFQGLVPYLNALVARRLDIVFFVPPYHLDRTPRGFASGDAFLATDFPDHIAAFGQALSDARTLIAWLRDQGARRIGAIGSSLGGSLLARLSTWDEGFDFLTLIAPVVRWELLVFQPEMAPVREELDRGGLDVRQVLKAYRAMDPTADRARVPTRHVAIFYGEHDRVAPKLAIFELASRWGIARRRLRGYDSGHALFFLVPALARDVLATLDRDLSRLGWDVDVQGATRPPPTFPLCP